jgi:hypothetical protein
VILQGDQRLVTAAFVRDEDILRDGELPADNVMAVAVDEARLAGP